MNIILVQLQDALFGLPAEAVLQVVESVQVTPLPFVPAHVEGLANVGAAVMPVIDLAQRLWDRPGDRQSGVILSVLTEDNHFGLRVNRVQMMVQVPEEDCTLFGDADLSVNPANVPPEAVSGEFSWQGRMVLLLAPEHLGFDVPDAQAVRGMPGALLGTETADGDGRTAGGTPEAAAQPPLLIVETSQERYAMSLEKVLESIAIGELTPVPKAPAEVEGLVSLRGHPLLIVSLARLLGRPSPPSRYAVVIQCEGGRFALGVERVVGLQKLPPQAHEEFGDGRGIVKECLVDPEGRLIGRLDVEHLFDSGRTRALAAVLPRGHSAETVTAARPVEERPLLTFWVGEELCGLDLQAVSRVVEYCPPTSLPKDEKAPNDLAGMVEVAGDVLPVVDLRSRFGRETAALPSTAYVVARAENAGWALVVDRVNRIVRLPIDTIRPTGGGKRYAVEIGQLNGSLISILALNRLVCG